MNIGAIEVVVSTPFPQQIREKLDLSIVKWNKSESYELHNYNGQYYSRIHSIINTFKDMFPSHSGICTGYRIKKFKAQCESASFETIFDRNEIKPKGTGTKGRASLIKKGIIDLILLGNIFFLFFLYS